MIAVKLFPRQTNLRSNVGILEFYGVPVTKPDGSAWIEFDELGEPRPGQVRLDPAGIATGAEIKAISHALARNELRGQAGRYDWQVE